MDRQQIRIELIKVLETNRRAIDDATIISMARKYESYIFEPFVADKAKVPADLPKVGPSTGKRKT